MTVNEKQLFTFFFFTIDTKIDSGCFSGGIHTPLSDTVIVWFCGLNNKPIWTFFFRCNMVVGAPVKTNNAAKSANIREKRTSYSQLTWSNDQIQSSIKQKY